MAEILLQYENFNRFVKIRIDNQLFKSNYCFLKLVTEINNFRS